MLKYVFSINQHPWYFHQLLPVIYFTWECSLITPASNEYILGNIPRAEANKLQPLSDKNSHVTSFWCQTWLLQSLSILFIIILTAETSESSITAVQIFLNASSTQHATSLHSAQHWLPVHSLQNVHSLVFWTLTPHSLVAACSLHSLHWLFVHSELSTRSPPFVSLTDSRPKYLSDFILVYTPSLYLHSSSGTHILSVPIMMTKAFHQCSFSFLTLG